MSEELKVDILLVLYANPRGVWLSDLRQAFLRHHGRPLEQTPSALRDLLEEMMADTIECHVLGGRERLLACGAAQAQAPARPQVQAAARPQAQAAARPQARAAARPQAQVGPSQQALGLPARSRPQNVRPSPAPSAREAREPVPASWAPGGSEHPRGQAARPLTYSQALQGWRRAGERPPTPGPGEVTLTEPSESLRQCLSSRIH
eukprot:g17822.t1